MIALTLAQLASVLDGRLHLASDDTPETEVSGGVDTDSSAHRTRRDLRRQAR